MGVHAGFYFSALDAYFNDMKLELHSNPDSELSLSARSVFVPYMNMLYKKDEGYALACFRDTCHEPLNSREALQDFLREKKYLENN